MKRKSPGRSRSIPHLLHLDQQTRAILDRLAQGLPNRGGPASGVPHVGNLSAALRDLLRQEAKRRGWKDLSTDRAA